jgi:hypothetical protein
VVHRADVGVVNIQQQPATGAAYDLGEELALFDAEVEAAEALSNNAVVQSWPELVRLAGETASVTPAQGELL